MLNLMLVTSPPTAAGDNSVAVSEVEESPSIDTTESSAIPTSQDDAQNFGLEQIFVCGTLLLITLLLLDPPKRTLGNLKRRLFRFLGIANGTDDATATGDHPTPPPEGIVASHPPEALPNRARSVSDGDAITSSSPKRRSIYKGVFKFDESSPSTEDDEHLEFIKNWPQICLSPYRKLALPPECRRVDPPTRNRSDGDESGNMESGEDIDWRSRIRWIVWFVRSVMEYDFVEGIWRFFVRISQCLLFVLDRRKVKHRQVVGVESCATEEEEEEEDDCSVSNSSLKVEDSHEGGETYNHDDASENEEKKESHTRTTSFSPSWWNKSNNSVDDPPDNSKRKSASTSTHPHINNVFPPSSQPPNTNAQKQSPKEHSTQPDKNGYIFPSQTSNSTPLLVFVNTRSGPQQGHLLIHQLRRLLNPIQVHDLAECGPPVKILQSFSSLLRLRILVCGGDGTVSWIISSLQQMELDRWPPIAILPLGTGNDLARVHGWGGGYNNESLLMILRQVGEAYVSLLDRWELAVVDKNKKKNKTNKIRERKNFTNYFGVGIDAQAALQVHNLRESSPKLFFSRMVNKLWYTVAGADNIINTSCADFPNKITLIADGVEIPLPKDSQGIIFLNIDSYTGGVPLWGLGSQWKNSNGTAYDNIMRNSFTYPARINTNNRRFSNSSFGPIGSNVEEDYDPDTLHQCKNTQHLTPEQKLNTVTACNLPSSCQDGMLDVISIRGTFHLGQIRVGLSNAQLICQCKEATILNKKHMAVHIDGEPWKQSPCILKISKKSEPALMLHRAEEEGGGVETEVVKLLDWAEERRIIDRKVHTALMREFSRRIESKSRQRRVRSQDNLMLSLKRALANNPSF